MTLVPAWAPNLHPVIVHFPVGLLVTASAVDLLSLLIGRHRGLRRTATLLFVLGTAAILAAYLSGRQAESQVWLPGMAHALVSAHADWAARATWFFAIFTALRLLSFGVARGEPSRALATVMALVSVAGVYLLYAAGDRGAQLVFHYGVGTVR